MVKKIEKIPIDKEKEKHMHDGHRLRVVNTVADGGFEFLSKIQQLEFILFFIFPRGDVNPLAHRLLNHYGSLYAVLEAPAEDLARITGMGEASAKKLSSFLQIYEIYQLDKFSNSVMVESEGEFYALLECLLRFKNEEISYIFSVSPSGVISNARIFGRGDDRHVNLNAFDLASYLKSCKASKIIFVHNHPNGDAVPSRKDEENFIKLNNMLLVYGCKLRDCIIVGRNGIYSWDSNKLVRAFTNEVKSLSGQESSPKKMIENK